MVRSRRLGERDLDREWDRRRRRLEKENLRQQNSLSRAQWRMGSCINFIHVIISTYLINTVHLKFVTKKIEDNSRVRVDIDFVQLDLRRVSTADK